MRQRIGAPITCGSADMPALHPGTTGRKSDQQLSTPPIIVSVRQAKALLGNMSHDRFWRLATQGAFGEIVGNKQKRYLYYVGIKSYADNLARAPYSKKIEGNTAA
jgi:hypothetical protein